ncbi:MAG: cell wall metabolism sensor histidine kinase WalK [Deltaproteobacteria bacterium]|nr:MAG: cell wall metabolism sensor histidine kinase WalK [Deltaproteobacteria bacterium]
MNLYRKLLLAQSPIALALAIVGVFSAVAISYLGSHSQGIMKDNYRSVLAAQRMKEAIERMDSAALFMVAGQREKGVEQVEKYRPVFEAELKVQEGNITERGEKEFTGGLRTAWTDYQAKFDRLQKSATTDDMRARYFSELEAAFYKVKSAADEILAINQDAMLHKSEAVRRTAERMNAITITVVLGAFVLGLVVSTLLTRRMLQPVSALSDATRKIGEGNFDTRAHVRGNDELAHLARDFNSMAARLAEYRKSSLGELLQAHLSMQAAIDSLPDPIIIFGTKGELQNTNLAAQTLLGLRAGEGQKEPLKALTVATSRIIERMRSHVLSGKGAFQPRGFEDAVQLPTLLGDRQFLPRATPVYETQGVVIGATVILQDVTRLRRLEELKNDVVATVAHEFRTPLTSLRMAVHLCMEQVVGPLTEKQAELLGTAREDCDRLQIMVDDLLDLSRIESGRAELFPLPTPVSELIERALDEHKAEADAKGVRLNADLHSADVTVLADVERIGHVFTNLIGNAIRYTPNDGTITLGAEVKNEVVRFTVSDPGKGIPKEYQARLFEKFFRVPDNEDHKGTGLGLYIAKEIVRGHGGDIGVESEAGKGSTFWFTLPTKAKAV